MDRKTQDLRLDILPESYAYRDNGCAVSRSCLRCPLPQCKYDDPNERRREARDRRDVEILALRRRERLTVKEVARRFGVSERTVFRAVQREREGGVGRGGGWGDPSIRTNDYRI